MAASKAQLEATDRAAAAETRAAATVVACDEKDARIAALEAMVARLDSEVRAWCCMFARECENECERVCESVRECA